MSLSSTGRLLALAAALSACAGDTSDPTGRSPDLRRDGTESGISLTLTPAHVTVGSELGFKVANGSSKHLTTGMLNCVASYERLEGDTWKPLQSLRLCVMMAEIHRAGETTNHNTPAPDGPGIYRLVIEGWLDGGHQVVVRSAPFTVTAP